jgi:uncharacterized membrane protein
MQGDDSRSQPPPWPDDDTPDTVRSALRVERWPDRACIRVSPNRSLSRIGVLVAAGACLSALIPGTLLCLLLGAWPMFPFLGLEIAVVVGAFAWLQRHLDDREEIILDAEAVAHRRIFARCSEDQRFPRYWVRLVVEPAANRFRPDRLWLRSHGQHVELARDAGGATRVALARILTQEFGITRAAAAR